MWKVFVQPFLLSSSESFRLVDNTPYVLKEISTFTNTFLGLFYSNFCVQVYLSLFVFTSYLSILQLVLSKALLNCQSVSM